MNNEMPYRILMAHHKIKYTVEPKN